MQQTIFKLILGFLITAFSITGFAADKTYSETEFLDRFGGRSKKLVIEKLGKPAKTNLSVKPSNADNVLRGKLKQNESKNSKRVKVEMWYYKNIVRYDDKHTYKETEITFVNDRVMNISFFNNR